MFSYFFVEILIIFGMLIIAETEKVEVPDVVIKEWIWSKGNPYDSPELVKAEHIGWPVPTIQRLWFG